MDDAAMIEAFISKRRPTACPPHADATPNPVRGKAKAGYLGTDSDAQGHRSAEERLAMAKLTLMFEDITGRPRISSGQNRAWMRDQAYRWFFGESDFEAWCDSAGYNPEVARKRARQIWENGSDWQRIAPAGTGKNYEKRKRFRQRKGLQPA